VHLVLPDRRLFAQTAAEPSASIALKMRGTPAPGQLKAIQHMVASAVEGLEPGSVSIVDESGQLLADGRGEQSGVLSTTANERKRAIEDRTRQEIQDIVASVVGSGRARVRVTAEMN
jgi:flagellar M-ring protein FliF